MSTTKLLQEDDKTGVWVASDATFDLPVYDIGWRVGWYLKEDNKQHVEDVIESFNIGVIEIEGERVTQIEYTMKSGIRMMEEDIDYYYPWVDGEEETD